jgi:hypothetical protein
VTRYPVVFAATFFCFLITSAYAQTVTPGQVFSGSLLNIKAPESEDWKVISSSSAGMAFGHRGSSSNESYIAMVSFFSLPKTNGHDEFIALIKQAVEQNTSIDRFKTISSNYEYTDQRGYPCVKFDAITEDTKAKASFFGHENLVLQIYSLYCRHPKHPDGGFVVSFSHRGSTLDETLKVPAEAFIEGVQVPEQ